MQVREWRLSGCTHMWAWLERERCYSCPLCLLLTVKAICHSTHTYAHCSVPLLSVHNYNDAFILTLAETFPRSASPLCILVNELSWPVPIEQGFFSRVLSLFTHTQKPLFCELRCGALCLYAFMVMFGKLDFYSNAKCALP